jgi:colanic acid/amylovoran biosynthesis glycosyltransferase
MGLRIGYVVSQYPATNHTFILREIRGLREAGFDITVVSIRTADRPRKALSPVEADEQAITFSVLGAGAAAQLTAHLKTFLRSPLAYCGGLWYALRLSGGAPPKILSYLFYFAEAVVAGEYLKRQGIGHLHTHFSSTVTLILGEIFPLSISMTIHGPSEFDDVIGFHMEEKVHRALFTATISCYGASQVMRASDPADWNRVHVLPLGVSPQSFAPRQLPERHERFECVCVGRLAPVKAHLVLFEAVARLVRQGKRHLHLTVVGDGPSRASLAAYITREKLESHIELVGACNQERVIEFYKNADAFTLASFAEGVPVVLMEAMSMEIPCVTTWINGVPELIRNEQDGLLVPPADAGALAEAIARLIDDAGLRERLGRSGRKRVMEAYDCELNIGRLAAVFRQYLETTL